MPRLTPFRGLRYTPEAGSLSELLAPPYDVINDAQLRELEATSPFNAVHLEVSSGAGPYARVARLLDAWQREDVLRRDERPMLYVYEQEFDEDGATRRRRALLCGVEAQPWEERAVRPHEFTMSGPKEDRLQLLRATRTQFSPIFMLARDRAGQLASFLEAATGERPPDAEGTTLDGCRHRFWANEATRFEMRALAPLLSESFYIADGHHRYETAVLYRDELNSDTAPLPVDHPARFAMSAVVPASDPGLVVRPIHRMVPRQAPDDWRVRLADAFSIADIELSGLDMDARAAELMALLREGEDTIVAMGLDPGMVHVLRPHSLGPVRTAAPGMSDDWVGCSPNLLRYGVLGPLWGIGEAELAAGAVEYTHLAREALEFAAGGPNRVAFLINRVSVETTLRLADKGERLPQKSTFFHPKMATGLVFHPLEP